MQIIICCCSHNNIQTVSGYIIQLLHFVNVLQSYCFHNSVVAWSVAQLESRCHWDQRGSLGAKSMQSPFPCHMYMYDYCCFLLAILLLLFHGSLLHLAWAILELFIFISCYRHCLANHHNVYFMILVVPWQNSHSSVVWTKSIVILVYMYFVIKILWFSTARRMLCLSICIMLFVRSITSNCAIAGVFFP